MSLPTLENAHERLAPFALVLAFVLALVASLRHVVAALAVLEPDGATWPALVGALAIDVGMVAILGAVAVAARRGRPVGRLLAALALFAGVSALANLDAAAAALTGARVTWESLPALDRLDVARALVYSAVLPVLVLVLAWAAEGIASARGTSPGAGRRALERVNGQRKARAEDATAELARFLRANPEASVMDAARALDWPRSTTRERWERAHAAGVAPALVTVR